MASKYDAKVVEIPSGSTQIQIENALKNAGSSGWIIQQIVQIGSKYFAILYKTLVQ